MPTTLLEKPVAQSKQLVSEVTAAPAPESQFERYDTIDTPRIVVIGFVSAILTFVIIVAAQAVFFMAAKAENDRKTLAVTDTAVEQVITRQEGRLADYSWVDPQAGIVSIPIEVAMRKVLAEERSKQSREKGDVR